MTTHQRVTGTDAAAQATGPQVRSIPPGSNAYILHEMREIEIDASVVLNLLKSLGVSLVAENPGIDEVCRALRDVDARLFVPEHRGR